MNLIQPLNKFVTDFFIHPPIFFNFDFFFKETSFRKDTTCSVNAVTCDIIDWSIVSRSIPFVTRVVREAVIEGSVVLYLKFVSFENFKNRKLPIIWDKP